MLLSKKTNNDGSVTFTFVYEEVIAKRVTPNNKSAWYNTANSGLSPASKEVQTNREDNKTMELVQCILNKKWTKAKQLLVDHQSDPKYIPHGSNFTPLGALLSLHVERNAEVNKNMCEILKLLFENGATVKTQRGDSKEKRLYYAYSSIISSRKSYEMLNLVLEHDNSHLNDIENNYTHYCVLRNILEYPNYRKFQLLLCHGLRFDHNVMQKFLPSLFGRYTDKSPHHWKRYQNRRKMVSTMLSWPKLMLIYCLLKKNVSPFIVTNPGILKVKHLITYKGHEKTVNNIL
jgi:hypothetical protein